MSGYIAIECDGVVQVHANTDELGFPYATFCGLAGNDPPHQKPAALCIGDRINCPQCYALIFAAKKYRPKDFESSLR